ncbi:hypothetical protein PR048_018963 [Dryococelus australis]|uniref:Uncharacterized protein n=1 Tax=Dryococelus australis TaxID=614101 RepID=A0ABQ9H254_9NEOP|nr:hypothetical protein PR048_018963 [Dryococelus australis]
MFQSASIHSGTLLVGYYAPLVRPHGTHARPLLVSVPRCTRLNTAAALKPDGYKLFTGSEKVASSGEWTIDSSFSRPSPTHRKGLNLLGGGREIRRAAVRWRSRHEPHVRVLLCHHILQLLRRAEVPYHKAKRRVGGPVVRAGPTCVSGLLSPSTCRKYTNYRMFTINAHFTMNNIYTGTCSRLYWDWANIAAIGAMVTFHATLNWHTKGDRAVSVRHWDSIALHCPNSAAVRVRALGRRRHLGRRYPKIKGAANQPCSLGTRLWAPTGPATSAEFPTCENAGVTSVEDGVQIAAVGEELADLHSRGPLVSTTLYHHLLYTRTAVARRDGRIPDKTRRPAASFGPIPTCENPGVNTLRCYHPCHVENCILARGQCSARGSIVCGVGAMFLQQSCSSRREFTTDNLFLQSEVIYQTHVPLCVVEGPYNEMVSKLLSWVQALGIGGQGSTYLEVSSCFSKHSRTMMAVRTRRIGRDCRGLVLCAVLIVVRAMLIAEVVEKDCEGLMRMIIEDWCGELRARDAFRARHGGLTPDAAGTSDWPLPFPAPQSPHVCRTHWKLLLSWAAVAVFQNTLLRRNDRAGCFGVTFKMAATASRQDARRVGHVDVVSD